jgi:hypothetical protein
MKLRGHEDLSLWRVSCLSGSMDWGVWVVGIAEILSILDILTFNLLVGSWIVTGISSAFFCFILVIQRKPSLHSNLPEFQWFEVLVLLGAVFIITILRPIVLIAPPNSYDGMTYHNFFIYMT